MLTTQQVIDLFASDSGLRRKGYFLATSKELDDLTFIRLVMSLLFNAASLGFISANLLDPYHVDWPAVREALAGEGGPGRI